MTSILKNLQKFILFLVILAQFTSCITTTRFNSTDPEATVISLSGGESEVGSLVYRDRKTFFGSAEIKIEKAGCKSAIYEIAKRDDFGIEGFLTGFFTFGIGWLWTTTYLPEYNLNYSCIKVAR